MWLWNTYNQSSVAEILIFLFVLGLNISDYIGCAGWGQNSRYKFLVVVFYYRPPAHRYDVVHRHHLPDYLALRSAYFVLNEE